MAKRTVRDTVDRNVSHRIFDKFCYCHTVPVAYPGIFFGGGVSTNSVEDRENGNLGVVAP